MRTNEALSALAPLLDQLTAGVQFIDPDMRYVYVNSCGATHGRTTTEALIGRTMSECYPGIEGTEIYRLIQEVERTGKSDALQNAFTFPDGSQGWFELRIYKVPGGVVVLSTDITSRKNLELHVRHAERMEAAGKLAGGIAHDFNNMLMVITSLTELFIDDEGLPLSHRTDLGHVLEAAQRASKLTRKLLALSSQFPGNSRQNIQIESFVQHLAPLLKSTLGPGITLNLKPSDPALHVKMDPAALEQLLVHLAQNARDAMGESGTVTIEADNAKSAERSGPGASRLKPGDYLSLRVRDSGPGISKEVIEKIFDPFYTTKADASSGLGLAMCWGFAEQAGGAIRVESEVGSGATFEILLPKKVVDETAVASLPAPSTHGAGQKLRILVVDDEPSVRKVVCKLAERQGHVTIGVASGAAALVALENGPPIDLVLTDLLMPEMSGLELVRQLRATGHTMPILLMSGYSPDHHALRKIPRWCLLPKPFSPGELRVAIDAALQNGAGALTA